MSTKIDCVIYLKSKLESEFTKLFRPARLPTFLQHKKFNGSY
jgi:hypothetical protein